MKHLFESKKPTGKYQQHSQANDFSGDGTGGASGRKNSLTLSPLIKPMQKKQDKLRTWGNYTFSFKFRTQGESMYQTSKSLDYPCHHYSNHSISDSRYSIC